MAITHQLRRLASVALIGGGIAFAAISTPIVLGALTPAAAQISEDAQVALEQYGSWRPHPRFGNVWVPTGVPPDWRPYAYGHWVYTDEWGWYWVSDDVEADWGWVVYHYGRWAFERGFGWYWVSGDEWAPAWVDWRYGDDYSGWAPLPPDELIGTYEVEPTYWVFVPTRYIAAPRLRTYYVPVQRRSVILRSTHIVNRTFAVRGSRLAVNPGISPAFVARVSGAPVSTFRVRPRVFASTQGVAGAVQIRREDLRRRARRQAGRPRRSRWAGRTNAPGHCLCRADDGGDSAKRCGHRSAATRKKRARPIGNTSAARRARRGTDAVDRARARAAAVTASTVTASAAKCWRANAATGLRFALGAAADHDGADDYRADDCTHANSIHDAARRNAPAERLERREERRDLRPPAGAGGGTPPAGQPAPPTQPNIVRPIPPQTPPPPPPPPPQERRVQPPPPPPPPPPPQQRQVQPPPPPAVRPPPPPPPAVRPPPPPPPPAARAPAPPPPPPAARAPAPPPQEHRRRRSRHRSRVRSRLSRRSSVRH